MAAFPNFDTSNSTEVGLNFDVLSGLNFDFLPISESQQRQTENGNRNNDSATASSLVSSASLTSQASHNFYSSLPSNMLPTPEGSGSENNTMCPESLMLSPYNLLPGSGHLTIDDSYNKDEDFFYEPLESPESGVSFIPSYIPAASYLSPQTSPTLPPDASMNINSNSPTRRQSQEKRFSPMNKPKKVSPNNKNSASQSRRKSSFTNSNNVNGNNSSNNHSNNSANGQNNAITNLSNIMTGSPDKLTSNSIAMLSLLELELTSPLMNDVVATSIAPSLQDNMPNLNLGSNLESDVTSSHSSTNIRPIESSSLDKLAPITPSSLMKLQKKQPVSPKSIQNELNTQQQQQKQQNHQDQSQQKKDYSVFIAPTQLNQVRPNMIATTGAASPSGAKKSIRSNPNASSPLALGPSKSPHSLKPTISPNLKPKLPGVLANEVAIAEQLASKSNYRSILEGTAQSLGISYPSDVHSSLESRRTTHKAAEQKRRDSLKQSFDELKKVVPYQSVLSKNDGNVTNNNKSNGNGKSGDGSMKNVSKLFLLKRAHDHILELEHDSKEKDEIIQNLKDELDMLKRAKKQKVEETEKKETANDEVDIETKHKNERQISSNEC